MKNKETLLLGIIISLLGAIMLYRIAFVDTELRALDDRIDSLIEAKSKAESKLRN